MHSTLFSALLFLVGMACIAAVMTRGKIGASRWPNLMAGGVLLSFLLLPTGPFPAYASAMLPVPMLGWFVLFSLGCSGVTLSTPRDSNVILLGHAACAPLFLGLTYAVCARKAAGFPGDSGHMETFATLPLGTGFHSGGTSLTQLVGITLLGLATLLFGAWFTRMLSSRRDIPYLSACLRLAVAAFTVCLFGSALVHLPLPARWTFLLEYALYWGMLGAVLTLQTTLAPYSKTSRAAWLLLGFGAVLSA